MNEESVFDTIEEAIAEIAAGRPIVVTDDEARENEGDLVLAASLATRETINMMIRWARGLICVPMRDEELRRLGLNAMVQQNRESQNTAFTVSVDAAQGITTGISAEERTRTIRILADPESRGDDLVQPGHVFPLRARPGGVLERAGHTEAAVDLALLAGLPPAGVVCEILNEDGSCARLPELTEYKRQHGLKMISIAALIDFRHRRENLVRCVLRQPLQTEFGEFQLHLFHSMVDNNHHFALTMGSFDEDPVLVRMHSENIVSDVFQARDFGSRPALMASFERIAQEGCGAIVYMSHACGGLQLPPMELGESEAPGGLQPAKMDFRAYGVRAQILVSLGIHKMRLISSTPRRVVGLEGYGLEIVEQISVKSDLSNP